MYRRASRHHKKIGWPEFGLLCAVVLAIAPATMWWRQYYVPEWRRTGGQITACETSRVHYNAQDYRAKAIVSYRYTVGVAQYTGRFEGFWPEVGGPNALPPSAVDQLKDGNREIVVFYDPANPSRSRLHPEDATTSPFWPVLTAAGLLMAGAYTLIAYPAWRA